MNCVKCGREIGEEQVFCELCLGEMEKYPVKPGTAIHIPARTTREETKKQHRRRPVLTPSEQILRLRKKVRRLRVALVLVLLICAGLCFVIGRTVMELDFQRILGQNYRTETVVETEPPQSPLERMLR